jgi:ADP-dependent NAD(P)H-hydrate dehydratase / NAD(P)H-hydrate epimerase
MKIVSVAQMRALEAAEFAAGSSEAQLQQRAALAVAEEVARLAAPGARVAVVVGHGNNGRDGALAGEWLAHHSRRVELVLAPRHAVTADELTRMRQAGVSTTPAEGVRAALSDAQVAVDALAGIGTHGALRDPLASLALALNEGGRRVVAVDVPSGIDADTGAVPGEAVRADVTVTLGAVKQGLLRLPAAEYVGRLVARDIGISAEAQQDLAYEVLEPGELKPPARPIGAHKYSFGRTLIVAGSDHFLGAPVLCSGGALRVGAGLVTVASTADVRRTVAAHLPEATYAQEGVPLETYLQSHQALVIGPGLGRGERETSFVWELLGKRLQGKAVIDADALFALSETREWWMRLPPDCVLTPHAGELQRLVGTDLPDEPAWATAGRLAEQWRCVLIAKGPFTAVAESNGQVHVWPHANPALATGGTGDVLAGMCGGFLAQGCTPAEAARLAVTVHALAAQRIVIERNWRTLLASDLLQAIPGALASIGRQRETFTRRP